MPVQEVGHWDELIDQLQTYRERVGSPSYGEIAERIAEARRRDGVDAHAARVPRTTVYDAFRAGRARVNLPLVREIGHAMGADADVVESWIRACDKPPPTPVESVPVRADAPAGPRAWVALVVGAIALNLLGRAMVDTLHVPLYLDMCGTAIAAIALGPWRGAAVGATTNLLGALISGWVSLPFVLVNVAGALVWGYGVRRFGMGTTIPRYFVLNLVVALACSVIAVPLLIVMLGQDFKDGNGLIVSVIAQTVPDDGVATGIANLLTSAVDKLVSGFVALTIIAALPGGIQRASRLTIAGQHAP